MDGLMMDFQLTLPPVLRRAETVFGDGEMVTRLPDKSIHRTTYRETMGRAKQLAVALQKLGLERGTRVATLCWNHHQHHEAYFGIPCGGFVLHTLNLRLHPNDLAYIATHADEVRRLVAAAPGRVGAVVPRLGAGDDDEREGREGEGEASDADHERGAHPSPCSALRAYHRDP